MNSKRPPIPKDNHGDPATANPPQGASEQTKGKNVGKQGQQGNTKVNTTHQGYQQDR